MSRVTEAHRDGVLAFLRELALIWEEYYARCEEAKEYHTPEPDMEFIQAEEFDAGWLLSGDRHELIFVLEGIEAAANHIGDQ